MLYNDFTFLIRDYIMSTKIELPTTFDEYTTCINKVISFYSGINIHQNRLNESIAKSLDFENYDQLYSLICDIEKPYCVNLDISATTINNIVINDLVFTDEMSDFYFADLEDYIDNLTQWISELNTSSKNYSSDKFLMLQDLKMLLSWDDETILVSVHTNHFISPKNNTKEFNEECLNILKLNETLN